MGKLIFNNNLFHNRKPLKVTENKCFRKGFLKALFIVTNPLLVSRVLVTGNNGMSCYIFSQEIIVALG